MADKKQVDIVKRMTIIGIAAAALIIIIASLFAMTMGGSDKTPDVSIPEPEETTAPVDEAEKVFERALTVVKHVDTSTGSLMVYDIEKLKMITLKMDSSIVIKDEYGTDITLAQIDLGDMVETKYDTISMKPENVKITAVTWERKDVSNMVVDAENKSIKISNDSYRYTDELVTSDAGKAFDISTLSTADEAYVRGYKDMVWSVVLVNGHGTIKLINHEVFIGGQLEIGNLTSFTIEADMVVPVTAGVHNVVVSKDNMSPYVTQVMVEEDKEVVIDLSEAQPQVGTVEFIVLQDGVTVYMDDELVNLEEELVLDFGTYKITAEKENFVTWEGELLLSQAYQQFKIDMDKTPTFVFINQPEGAEAYLDGVPIGLVPTQAPFSAGSHTVQLSQEGYRPSEVYNYIWDDDGLDKYLVLPQLIELPPETTTATNATTDIYGNPITTAPETETTTAPEIETTTAP